MELRSCLLTENDCYRAGGRLVPRGVMVHSTGADNPNLRRYVQPDDGLLGGNANGNHWNRTGVDKCVHAFIGRDKGGHVAVYQTLPWTMRGWHAGGSGNNTHISFEICEDGLEDRAYFEETYRAAVELTAYLCRAYRLDPQGDGVVLCHAEGYQRGIASQHGDVLHWWPKFGRSMDDFRSHVAGEMEEETMTSEAFEKLYDSVNPLYTSLDQVPDYWREEAAALVAAGAIQGDGENPIAIRREALQAAIVNKRYTDQGR